MQVAIGLNGLGLIAGTLKLTVSTGVYGTTESTSDAIVAQLPSGSTNSIRCLHATLTMPLLSLYTIRGQNGHKAQVSSPR